MLEQMSLGGGHRAGAGEAGTADNTEVAWYCGAEALDRTPSSGPVNWPDQTPSRYRARSRRPHPGVLASCGARCAGRRNGRRSTGSRAGGKGHSDAGADLAATPGAPPARDRVGMPAKDCSRGHPRPPGAPDAAAAVLPGGRPHAGRRRRPSPGFRRTHLQRFPPRCRRGRVTIAGTAAGWLLVVDDEAPDHPPVPAVGRDRALGGMGLGMVAGLALQYGWQPGRGRKSVWAELPSHR